MTTASLLPKPTVIKKHELVPETSSYIISSPISLALSPGPQPVLAIATDSIPVLKYLLVEPHTSRVLIECFTGALQTAYSTAVVVWQPSGKGEVWVNADDRVIRGVEAGSGKVVAELNGGHEYRRKVRTLWAGEVEGREMLVSGGFEGQLILWECIMTEEWRVRNEPAEPATARGEPAEPATAREEPAEPATARGEPAEPATARGEPAEPATAREEPAEPATAREEPAEPATETL
ncbi:hypothetical protein EV426DRAFT_703658 [Tirmania nivea]|nr:hypothetical protein EV426DRAFT_703658 [Tirmania nivea]